MARMSRQAGIAPRIAGIVASAILALGNTPAVMATPGGTAAPSVVPTDAPVMATPSVAGGLAPHRPRTLFVAFRPGTAAASRAAAAASLDAQPGGLDAASTGGTHVVAARAALSRLAAGTERWTLRTEADLPRALTALAHNPNVRYAEPEYAITLADTSNDPRYTSGELWGMHGNAVAPGANAFGSGADEAWLDGHTGSASVVVGIVDGGVDITHPDLAANIWTNPFETPDNGIDDDGNGYIDDVHGWDFAADDNTLLDNGDIDHGTHVAGTVGAVGGNGEGVAGVAWHVTLVPAKVIGPSGFTGDAVEALDYLTDLRTRHGLNVVASNNSWGGAGDSQALEDAINRGGDAGILFVAAAGNDGANNDNVPTYPASNTCTVRADGSARGFDCLVSVAAITQAGALASFSNRGAASVDLGAPGEAILSTVPGGGYGVLDGTSQAAPHVTGAIALCASMNGALGANELRAALLGHTTLTSSLVGKVVTSGRLDVGGMTATCLPGGAAPSGAPSGLTATTLGAGRVQLAWTDGVTGEAAYEVQVTTGTAPACGTFTTAATLPAGTSAYPVAGLTPNTAFCFRVRGTSPNGASGFSGTVSAVTAAATLPAIALQPDDQAVADGTAVRFTTGATGDPVPTVRWQAEPAGGAWADIPGASGTTLAFTPSRADTGTRYRAIFTNAAGTATTDEVALAVSEPGTYACVPEVFAWTDPAGGTILPVGAAGTASLALPFTFSHYGLPFTSVTVAADGYLVLGPGGTAGSIATNAPIPGATAPSNLVAAAWDDWDPGAGSVSARTTGTAPNRRVVITWDGVTSATGGGTASFQASLAETTGVVRLAWLDMVAGGPAVDHGAAATAGVEDVSGTVGTPVSHRLPHLADASAVACTYVSPGLPVPPFVTTQPLDATLLDGQLLELHATAGGSPAPTVRWQAQEEGGDFTDIPGETSTTLSLLATPALSGTHYRAIFTNTEAAVTTRAAVLTVPDVAGELATALGTASVTITGAQFTRIRTQGVPAVVGTVPAASFPREGATFAALSTGNVPDLTVSPATPSSLTPPFLGAATTLRVAFTVPPGANCLALDYRLLADAFINNGDDAFVAELDASTWSHNGSVLAAPLDFARTPAGDTVRLATIAGLLDLGPGATTGFAFAGPVMVARTAVTPGAHSVFLTVLDQGTFHQAATGVLLDGLRTSTVADSAADCGPGLGAVVTGHPADQTVADGFTAGFSATATGVPAPTLQWQTQAPGEDWVSLPGATASELALPVTLEDSGRRIRMVATNEIASSTSLEATITVVLPTLPSVISQPADRAVAAGATASFGATGEGVPAPTIQWQARPQGGTWADIPGATNTLLSFTTTAGDHGRQFRAVFTNAAGSTASRAALLVITNEPRLLALAMTTPSVTMLDALYVARGSGTPNGVRSTVVGEFPTAGSTYAVLTSAAAVGFSAPDRVASRRLETVAPSPAGARGDEDFDTTILRVNLEVPEGANCLAFDARLVTNDSGTPATAFNDAFVAELDVSDWSLANGGELTAPHNIAVDGFGRQISMRTTGVDGLAAPPDGLTAFASASELFAVRAPAAAGVHALFLSIFDAGDDQLDTGVLVDNLRTSTVADPAADCVPDVIPATAPVITGNPEDVAALPGETVQFSASASGAPAAQAHWQLLPPGGEWADLPGSTGPNLSLTVGPEHDGAQVRAVFTNMAGTATTNAATIHVTADTEPPVVTLDAVNGTTMAFPLATRLPITSLGGTCTTGDGDVAVGVDGGAPGADTSACLDGTWTVTLASAIAAEGIHTVEATQADAFANLGTSGLRTIQVDLTRPTTTAPATALRSGASLAATALPVTVSWTGSDGAGGSGIATYELQRSTDGGATWTVVSAALSSPSAAATLAPGRGVRFRVRATDVAGNAGAWWSTGPVVTPALAQEGAATYAGTWSTVSSTGYSGGTAKTSRTAGSSARLTFTGKAIAIVMTRAPGRGKVRIYVDGAATPIVVDTVGATTTNRFVVWARTWGASGTHTIRVVCAGTGGRPRVDLDAFGILR